MQDVIVILMLIVCLQKGGVFKMCCEDMRRIWEGQSTSVFRWHKYAVEIRFGNNSSAQIRTFGYDSYFCAVMCFLWYSIWSIDFMQGITLLWWSQRPLFGALSIWKYTDCDHLGGDSYDYRLIAYFDGYYKHYSAPWLFIPSV